MKTQTLVIIAVIVFVILVASYWHATEQYRNTDAGANSKLNIYNPIPTLQLAAQGFKTSCDGVITM